MNPRPADDGRVPEYTPEQVEALTSHAEDLLDELHEVMSQLADRLQVLAGKGI